jgi:hypothetical protein
MFLEYKELWEANKDNSGYDNSDYENYIDFCSEWFDIIEDSIEN